MKVIDNVTKWVIIYYFLNILERKVIYYHEDSE